MSMSTDAGGWRGPPVSLISLGCAHPPLLCAEAQAALAAAALVFGSARQLESLRGCVPPDKQRQLPSPFAGLLDELFAAQDQPLAVLASGDGLLFGVGGWLIEHLGRNHVQCYANVSSLQLGFHRAGLAWQDARLISLHGRPLSGLRRHLAPGALLGVLVDSQSDATRIAQELVSQGFADSTVWVGENLGSRQERLSSWQAEALAEQPGDAFHPLHVCMIEVAGQGLGHFPGLPDNAFATPQGDGRGMLSKRETRLQILSLMSPEPGETAWDIGAGCGGVSVEWARWNRQGYIYAIECETERCEYLEMNQTRFGVGDNMHIVPGSAPGACAGLPAPQSIFIGGSGGRLGELLGFAFKQLRPGGKLCACAVTEASRAVLKAFNQASTAQRLELAVTLESAPERLPVLLAKFVK